MINFIGALRNMSRNLQFIVAVALYFGGGCNANLKRGMDLEAYPTTYTPTKGEPWPKPQQVTRYGQLFMVVRPSVFRFEVRDI